MDPTSSLTAQQRLDHILALENRGDRREAIRQAQGLVDDHPTFVPGWMQLGQLYRANHDYAQSLHAFETTTTLNPDHPRAKIELAFEQVQLNQLDQAKSTLESLLTDRPHHILGLRRLGEIYRRQGDRTNAMKYFQAAVEADSTDLWANLQLSSAFRESGAHHEAKQLLLKALEHHPNNVNIFLQLGETATKTEQFDEAIAHYQQAINVSPQSLEPHFKIADILRAQECEEKEKSYLEELQQSHPNDYRVTIRLGYLTRKQGQLQQALEWFQASINQASEPFQVRESHLCVSESLRDMDRLDEAAAVLEPIVDQWPQHARTQQIWGTILQRSGNVIAAIDCYRQLLDRDDHHFYTYVLLAQSLKALGRVDEAIELLENAPEQCIQQFSTQKTLGELYRSQNNRTQALTHFQRALIANPTDLWANLLVAIEYRETGQFDEAEKQIRTAQSHHPNNVDVLLQLGELEQKRQQPEKAIAYFQQAQSLDHQRLEPSLHIIKTLLSCNQFEKAEVELNRLLVTYANDYQILIQFGYLERQRDRHQQALNWFQTAQDQATQPSDIQKAQILAIEERRDLGQLDLAQQQVEVMLTNVPDDIRCQMLLGSILQQKPDFAAAIEIYRTVLSIEPNHVQAHIQMSIAMSYSGQATAAIELLKDTHDQKGPHFQVMMRIVELAIALEDWDTAQQWGTMACQQFPLVPWVHCSLATALFFQGRTKECIYLLEEAQQQLPYSAEIPVKQVELNMRLGNLDEAEMCLQLAHDRFPDHIPLQLQWIRLHIQAGAFQEAVDMLDRIQGDRIRWTKQVEQLRGEIAFQQYRYEEADRHFRKALAYPPDRTYERTRLAIIAITMGNLDEAALQLRCATDELGLKTPPGKVPIPLISHPAKILNAFQIDPFLCKQLLDAQGEYGEERLFALAHIVLEDPAYLGTAIALTRELRQQSVFEHLRHAMTNQTSIQPSIPKRIVQYWDSPNPPAEIETLCKSWQVHNPEYEYKRFSYEEAIAFLQTHYSDDKRVLKAFEQCDQPATQADFFRLAYLNKMGGFYADADDRCRRSLDSLVDLSPELIVLQEDFACIGNNFIGCIPGQTSIRTAFYQATTNLLHYSADSPWFQTGPGLITSTVCCSLLPYLSYVDYHLWPRLLVLKQAELRAIVTQHIDLPYKRTEKSWNHSSYNRKIGN